MDEYIKREDVIKHLRGACIAKYPQSFYLGILASADEISKLPTADVVPKSEVEKQKLDIWRLQGEVERLKAEKDALIKNYAECMKDYAREIFAEIEKLMGFNNAGLAIITVKAYEELKKKYTEGE